ncbi:MAG: hypothetical protein R3E96_00460 [Planctomycetota bacterium]
MPQKKLATYDRHHLAQLLCLRLGRLKDEGRFTPQLVSMASQRNNTRQPWP